MDCLSNQSPLNAYSSAFKYTNMQKDGREEENRARYATESRESKVENLVSSRCRNKLDSERTLKSNVRRSRASSSFQELFLPNIHGSIPKRITTFDENYVSRCLELIRNCALRAGAGNFASKVHTLPDGSRHLVERKIRGSGEMAKLAIQQFGSIDFDVNFGRTSLLDANEPVYNDFVNSPYKLSNSLSHKSLREVTVVDRRYTSHRRLFSISSINSSGSDKSSTSSASATSFQGKLHCTWKDGLPRHVLTVDDRNEVYAANMFKMEPSRDNVFDYVYTFHLRGKGKKQCDCQELELDSVAATMRVSTSFTFCSDNSQVRETQFIMSLSSANPASELQISTHNHRKSKRLTKKVGKVFGSSHSYKLGSSLKLWDSTDFLEKDCVPSLELAAIIVKEISKNHKEDYDLGGWGLKFLKKSGKGASPQTFSSKGECSTSMDILIPNGLHGGQKTRDGGPSSLIERWISGGHCDCGGWDIGCPLTILNTGSNLADNSEECKSIDIFVQGSKQDVPILRMVNIHEGTYYIHFQSNLSTLQSFAIAAAVIHSRSPFLG